MPRYFFDLDLNGQMQQDTSGRELDDREEARKRANDVVMGILSIWDRARDLKCACTVRDEQGGQVYRHSTASADTGGAPRRRRAGGPPGSHQGREF
jgi:hypothetical protein